MQITYKGFGYAPITSPIRWDGEVLRSGWLFYVGNDVITFANPDENPLDVIDSLEDHES